MPLMQNESMYKNDLTVLGSSFGKSDEGYSTLR
jgi:hypothetical protein